MYRTMVHFHLLNLGQGLGIWRFTLTKDKLSTNYVLCLRLILFFTKMFNLVFTQITKLLTGTNMHHHLNLEARNLKWAEISIYLSLHRVPMDVSSMNKISPSVPILSIPYALRKVLPAMISFSHLFLGLPCLLVPGTISIRMRLGRRMLLILHTWPNQDSCDSVMRARILLGLNLQEEILEKTSSLRILSFQVMLKTFM